MDLSKLLLQPMQPADLDEVMAIELAVYSYPWSRGSFVDSLMNHDNARVLRAQDGAIMAYFVQMAVLDESHLLNIAVQGLLQNQGLGNYMLGLAVEQATLMQMKSMLLEVRVSNRRALQLYEKFGFVLIGRRKNYYRADAGQREDALVMRYAIPVQDQFNVAQ